MFCTCCGKEIINTARFCNYCGNPVRNIAPPPAPSQPVGQPGSVPFTPNIPTPETIVQPQPEAPQSVPVNAPDEFAPTDAISDITSDIISDRIDVPTDTEAQPLVSEPTVSGVTETTTSETTPIASESAPMTSETTAAAPEASREFSQAGKFVGAVPPFAPNGASDVYSAPIPPQYPTPGNIPKSGFSAPGYQMPSAPAPQEKPKRERKYTLGHIMLCLAAVAVMAITAGVFAGLYFSVV